MIQIFLDEALFPFESDIRELCKAFYPGEDFQLHTPEGVRLMETTQEEKNALKRAKEQKSAVPVNKKSLKRKDAEKQNRILTEEGISDPSLFRLSLDLRGAELSFSGKRTKDKSIVKAYLYRILEEKCGRSLPWGDLTGIRPVSLSGKLLEELEELTEPEENQEKTEEEERFYTALKDEYCLEGEKAELLHFLAIRERKILQRAEEKSGVKIKDGFSIYIHIPFCPSKCAYCSFLSSPIGPFSDCIPEYLDKISEELDFALYEMGEKRGKTLQSIYIGGGTPTALPPKELEALLLLVEKKLLSSPFSKVLEYTVEAGRPDSLTENKLALLKAHSVDRISINPQTFRQETLDLIGRKHSVESVVERFYEARALDFDNINMDLILGLPSERLSDVEESLRRIHALSPDNLTVHSLAVKRAAKLKTEENKYRGAYQAGASSEEFPLEREFTLSYIPSWKKRESRSEMEWMMLSAMQTAEELSLFPYYLYRQKNMAGNLENIGFSKEGKECLYNIFMMEEKHTVFGVGAGSSSKILFGNGRLERVDNGKDFRSYMEHFAEYQEKKRRVLEELRVYKEKQD
ncbi:coproporphyrinogen dehydrogenase HemZ [Oribacterium parvum ACB1]|uniref:Coproporphyrinogen dehydrogenase HemZ n=1 Tax=Oribacterium parvum ACB1 TaxID=796943 RepID=G9WK48_9FIRM|nr:coproporphyrinogen dehydrogenase HemZ [Oribacterium parvum]EHL14245.1 coproporphyrinogen dehydrogenase HemZ [Oribacterium parvum ACB1]EJF13831.1 coproporphyrinogen dehydrogenase HemZ [Oribacterium parvum ACB8]